MRPRPLANLARACNADAVTRPTDSPRHRPRRVPEQRPGPKGGKRDLNRKRRIADLCRAGAELMLAKGVERVTIDEICKAAGIAKGGFYRYFKGKTELVEAIVEPMFEGLRAALDASEGHIRAAEDFDGVTQAFGALGLQLAPLMLAEHRALRLYLAECNAPRIGARAPLRAWSDEAGEIAARLIAAAMEKTEARPLSAAVVGRVLVGAVERLAFDLLNQNLRDEREQLDPAEVARTVITLFLDGLRAR